MYLSRIRLLPGAEKSPDFLRLIKVGDQYHRLIWDLFGDRPERKRDFLYRAEGCGAGIIFYTLSARVPHSESVIWKVEPNEFAPKLARGTRLAFSLRANPTQRRSRRRTDTPEDAKFVGKRVDVVMDAKRMAARESGREWHQAEAVQALCTRWLKTRADRAGFSLDEGDVRVDGYQQHRVWRGKGKREARFSTVEFNGLLIVREPELFVESLFTGIGPEKAFGCGLMLIRRV